MIFSFAISMQRFAHALRRRNYLLSLPLTVFYRLFSLYVLSIDIPVSTRIGRNVRIFHGFGLVIHPNAVLGDNVVLRHGVTIGALEGDANAKAPLLGDSVDVGAGALILGDISIGSFARIGAGAIVIADVPERAICRPIKSEIYKQN